MKKSIQIGAAYIGVVVGAGFASGQEILQFFTSFGYFGIAGSLLATVLFAFIGMSLTQLGSRLQSNSHKDVIHHICGRFFGVIIDVCITFFLFSVTVVMFSGAAILLEQQFGIPVFVGSAIMAIITILSVMLSIEKVIGLIAMMTPFFLVLVVIITVHALSDFNLSFVGDETVMAKQTAAAPNWLLGAILYVSYNIALGASMLTVLGGTVKDEKIARRGGIIGGLGLGLLIILMNLSILAQLQHITNVPMPMLYLANRLSPTIGMMMSIVLLGMIYNTAVAMLYAFTARIVKPETPKFNGFVTFFGGVAFAASFVGFVKLVGTVYPIMGYLGFMLIGAIILSKFTK